jgi:hypothetical protein
LLDDYADTYLASQRYSGATEDVEASIALLDDSIRQIAGVIAIAKVHREADRSDVGELSDRIEYVLEILRQVPQIVRDELPVLQRALDEFASSGEDQAEVVEEVRGWIKVAMQGVYDTFPHDIDFDGEYLIDQLVAYAMLGGPNAKAVIAFLNQYLPGRVPTLQYTEPGSTEELD